jgi:hypothetical protein
MIHCRIDAFVTGLGPTAASRSAGAGNASERGNGRPASPATMTSRTRQTTSRATAAPPLPCASAGGDAWRQTWPPSRIRWMTLGIACLRHRPHAPVAGGIRGISYLNRTNSARSPRHRRTAVERISDWRFRWHAGRAPVGTGWATPRPISRASGAVPIVRKPS